MRFVVVFFQFFALKRATCCLFVLCWYTWYGFNGFVYYFNKQMDVHIEQMLQVGEKIIQNLHIFVFNLQRKELL